MNALTRRVADSFIGTLQELGAKEIWGIPGGTISPVVDAARCGDITLQTCINEATAGYLAMGVSAAGGVGVLYVTSGPGALGALPAIAAATQDGLPLLVLVGDVKTSEHGLGVIQDGSQTGLDMLGVVRPLAKSTARIEHAHQASLLLQQAWHTATSGSPGAVVLICPMDVMRQTEFQPKVRLLQASPGPIPPVAELRERAQRGSTLLAIGGQALRAGLTPEELLAAACALDAQVAIEPEARGLMDELHPRYAGRLGIGGQGEGLAAMRRAKLVISLGCRLDDTVTGRSRGAWRPAGHWVQVDSDPSRLGRSACPDQAWRACPRRVVQALGAGAVVPPWTRTEPSLGVLNPSDPRSLLAHLHLCALGKVGWWVSDIGNHLLFMLEALRFRRGERVSVSMGLGGMGSGVGVAIGVAHQRQERTVLVVGDGGLRMFGNELLTATRLGVPLSVVLLDDRGLGMVRQGMQADYGGPQRFDQGPWQAQAWARSLGVQSFDAHSPGALQACLQADGVSLLHARIDRDTPAPTPRFGKE